jgi:hypothetical protein
MPIQAIQLLRPAVQLLGGYGWDHEGVWERFFEVWHLCCGRFFGMFYPHISPFAQRRRWIPQITLHHPEAYRHLGTVRPFWLFLLIAGVQFGRTL